MIKALLCSFPSVPSSFSNLEGSPLVFGDIWISGKRLFLGDCFNWDEQPRLAAGNVASVSSTPGSAARTGCVGLVLPPGGFLMGLIPEGLTGEPPAIMDVPNREDTVGGVA